MRACGIGLIVGAAGIVAGTVGTASADRGDPFDGATMGSQVVIGFVGMGGGVLAGGLVVAGLDVVAGSPDSWLCSEYTCLGAVAGVVVGHAVGVQLVGDVLDGNGRWWGTAIGTGIGYGSAYVGFRLIDHYDLELGALGVVLFGSAMLAAPIAGYHLSAIGQSDETDRAFMITIAAGRL